MSIADGTDFYLQVSIPVTASDATRTESLGPPLIALLLNLLGPGNAQLYGDSRVVVGILNREFTISDSFLFNTQ